jgi:formate-dependent nitrite reductase cytochrome c552 subunit
VTFVQEEMAKVHLKEEITCVKCHGLSAAHANDENIGATKPDITYRREQIDASCRKCHETHDAPATQVIARWQEIGSPRTFSACTDCHGTHKIEQ